MNRWNQESIFALTSVALTAICISWGARFYFGSGPAPPETCQADWIAFNRAGLQADLNRKMFGQHIASELILTAVSGFMRNDNPKRPLVLSLHGTTGTGKNHISKLIASNIYKKGMESQYVHVFTADLHFPHAREIDMYKAQLQQWIRGNVTNCTRSMFIFDETDKMNPALINSIKPFLDYYENIGGVSYRKSIFIFLSNAGGESIRKIAFEFWKEGRDRSQITNKHLEETLSVALFNNPNSGFHHSRLIDKSLVHFVPFLPLESRHVVQCTMATMEARGMKPNQRVAEQLARDLLYFPKLERAFSVKGCKAINSMLYYLDTTDDKISSAGDVYVPNSENCSPQWINFFARDLESELQSRVFGQHLAAHIIPKALDDFLSNDSPEKPLVMSLFGSTGTGKNFVTSMIVNSLYKKGMDSSFVHFFNAELHFPTASKIDTYKSQLKHWIKDNVTSCARSMFIFDEVDYMDPSLLDSIKLYLDYSNEGDGVPYQRSIFIFISNGGGENIVRTTLEFWKAGRDRSEIELKDLEMALEMSLFHKRNDTSQKNVVDQFVPFLPLELRHVVQCTMVEMKTRGFKPDESIAEKIAKDLIYFPRDEQIFSVRGCKSIDGKVDYHFH